MSAPPQPAQTPRGATPPSLAPLLARGALLSPFKRPRPGAGFGAPDGGRLTLSGVRADPSHLAAYARVCGFPTDGGGGGSEGGGEDRGGHASPAGGELPLTYPHVLGFPLAMSILSRRDFPLPLLGLVHTGITLTRHRPLPAGRPYELAVRVAGLAPHRRGTEAAVVTVLRADGEPVWESTSTYLARHRVPGAPAPTPDGRTERPAPLPLHAEWRLGAGLGRRYAAVSGDRNPIHLHPLTARLFGFPRPLAHGIWTAARCLAALGTPTATRVRIEFRSPVLLPGTVRLGSAGGEFEVREAGEAGRVLVRGRVAGADG
ncbi:MULTISPECIES: MaoC family dehydratase [unclassified Streptomyces]|uniref:MaoC family dehydratase n=1 Tax=unclassified Streptomyces TaxID=2593676 RepID=UPI00381C13E5